MTLVIVQINFYCHFSLRFFLTNGKWKKKNIHSTNLIFNARRQHTIHKNLKKILIWTRCNICFNTTTTVNVYLAPNIIMIIHKFHFPSCICNVLLAGIKKINKLPMDTYNLLPISTIIFTLLPNSQYIGTYKGRRRACARTEFCRSLAKIGRSGWSPC